MTEGPEEIGKDEEKRELGVTKVRGNYGACGVHYTIDYKNVILCDFVIKYY